MKLRTERDYSLLLAMAGALDQLPTTDHDARMAAFEMVGLELGNRADVFDERLTALVDEKHPSPCETAMRELLASEILKLDAGALLHLAESIPDPQAAADGADAEPQVSQLLDKLGRARAEDKGATGTGAEPEASVAEAQPALAQELPPAAAPPQKPRQAPPGKLRLMAHITRRAVAAVEGTRDQGETVSAFVEKALMREAWRRLRLAERAKLHPGSLPN